MLAGALWLRPATPGGDMPHAIENLTKRIFELNPKSGRSVKRAAPRKGTKAEKFCVRLGSSLDTHVRDTPDPEGKIVPPRRVLSDAAFAALMKDPIAGPVVRSWVKDRTVTSETTADTPDIFLPGEETAEA